MRVLVDGQPLQSGVAPLLLRSLPQALRATRPGWDFAVLESSHLPPAEILLPVGFSRLRFDPPRPVQPVNRRDVRINERYSGDWVMAHGVDAFVILDYFDPKTVVPCFSEPGPRVVGVVRDLATFRGVEGCWQDAEYRQFCCRRFRALLGADALVVPSAEVEGELRDLAPFLAAQVIVAEDLATGICEAATIKVPALTRSRPRIAWVSPIPTAPSGIADYSADLLPALARSYDIDLVIDADQPGVDPALAARHLTLTAGQAVERHRARPYDLFVYQMGNSGCHAYMLDLMRCYRGLVVLHDYFLAGFVGVCRSRGLLPAALRDAPDEECDADLADWRRLGHCDDAALRTLTAQNRRLLSLADAVVVHSEWSRQRVRRLTDVEVTRVPMPMPLPEVGEDKVLLRRRLGLPATAFLIASLGHTGRVKRLPSLLHGVAGLPPVIRAACHVVLVGAMDATEREELFRLADQLGLAGQVISTGRVSAAEFTAHIRAADVCVQLRYPTFGETSASVLRILAAGTPCIASDQGPMAELPDAVVPKIRTPHAEIDDLTAWLETLFSQPECRAALAAASRQFIAEQHRPELAAAIYAEAMERTIARRVARDANWHETSAAMLLDGPVRAGPECDRLVADWATLRELALGSNGCRSDAPTRKAG